MGWGQRLRANLGWSLVVAVVIVEGNDWRRVALILLLAVVGALVQSAMDAANVRWSTPLRWPRRRSRNGGTV